MAMEGKLADALLAQITLNNQFPSASVDLLSPWIRGNGSKRPAVARQPWSGGLR